MIVFCSQHKFSLVNLPQTRFKPKVLNPLSLFQKFFLTLFLKIENFLEINMFLDKGFN